MTRRIVVPLCLATLAALVLFAHAEPPAANTKPDSKEIDTKPIKNEAAIEQDRITRQFREFKHSLMTLQQRLAKSDRPEDIEKAKLLDKALSRISDDRLETKFAKVLDVLTNDKQFSLEELTKLDTENKELVKDIKAILDILLADDRDNQLKREIEETTRLLEKLKEVIRAEENIRAWTERNMDKNKLGDAQKGATTDAKRLLDPSAGKNGQKGEAKAGEAKGTQKDGEAKAGEGKNDTRDGKGNDKEGKKDDGNKDGNKDSKESGSKDAGKDGGKEGGQGKDGAKDGQQGKEGGQGKDGGKEGGKEGGQGKDGGKEGGKDGGGSKAGGKDGQPGGDKKDAAGSKEGSKDANSGQSKPDAKPGDGKPGDAKNGGKPGDGKPGDGKPGDSKPGDSKGRGENKGDSKGQAGAGKPGDGGKPSDGGGKPSDSKGAGQPGQPPSGSKSGQQQGGGSPPPSGGQPPKPSDPGRKKIADGIESQEKTQDDLDKGDNKKASSDEKEAIDKFKEAQKKLEDLLRQLRQEEIERKLANLQGRCQRMLEMQVAVNNGTGGADRDLQAAGDDNARRLVEQASGKLSEEEDKIVQEATKAIQLLESDGTAVAFPEVLKATRNDMMNVSTRLRKTDTGVVTQAIEKDIEEALKEMIAALKKARQENQQKPQPGQPGQQGPPQDQKLIEELAELKMIRSMQVRINNRTETYAKEYSTKGEEQVAPEKAQDLKERDHLQDIKRELKQLGDAQTNVYEITKKIAQGKNK